MLCGYRS
jgi:predicted transposase YbfD/YdcC